MLEISTQPQDGLLSQNFPNPFKQTAQITYTLQNQAKVSIKVNDLYGREIQSYVNAFQDKGKHALSLDAANLQNGIYYYTLFVNDQKVASKRMLVAK